MPVAAPPVDMERRAGRSPDDKWAEALEVGLEGAGGDDGEGEPKGVSASNSPSGVEAVESMVIVAASSTAG